MRKVLIPTDFSSSSRNAFYYALQLYGNSESSFDVVHIYHTSFDPSQPTVLDFSLGIDKIKKENVETFVNDIPDAIKKELPENIKINGKVIMGFAAEQLVSLSKEYDVIIMGTTGAHQLADKIFGTISLEVARKAYCPIYLIPSESSYIKLKNIIYSCDFKGVNPKILEKIIGFADRFDARIHFIHVSQEEDSLDMETELKQLNFPIAYSSKTIRADSISEGLNKYVEDNDIEMVIMATKHRGFWAQIMHKSVTKKMAINSQVPLLIYHE